MSQRQMDSHPGCRAPPIRIDALQQIDALQKGEARKMIDALAR